MMNGVLGGMMADIGDVFSFMAHMVQATLHFMFGRV